MPKDKEYLINSIFNKLKNNYSKKFILEKEEFTKFIYSLLKND